MLQVLITRPLEASQQLAASLGDAGLKAIIMPLYSFGALSPSMDMHGAWQSGGGRKLAVFTSPRAVHFGLRHIPQELAAELEYAAVGSATRKRLEDAGHQVQLQAQSGYTSEDLLQLPSLAKEPGAAVVFAAPGGRETLAGGLAELGWTVSMAMVYERCALKPTHAQIDAIADAGKLMSIWTSVSAVELAAASLPDVIWQKVLASPILVISARIAHHLQQMGARRTALAAGPGNKELLQSIRQLAEQNEQRASEP